MKSVRLFRVPRNQKKPTCFMTTFLEIGHFSLHKNSWNNCLENILWLYNSSNNSFCTIIFSYTPWNLCKNIYKIFFLKKNNNFCQVAFMGDRWTLKIKLVFVLECFSVTLETQNHLCKIWQSITISVCSLLSRPQFISHA